MLNAIMVPFFKNYNYTCLQINKYSHLTFTYSIARYTLFHDLKIYAIQSKDRKGLLNDDEEKAESFLPKILARNIPAVASDFPPPSWL